MKEKEHLCLSEHEKERGNRIVKSLSRALLALYLLLLLWLVLFKLSFDLWSVILTHQTRSINLIPFAGSGNLGEIIDNCVVFIPLGLLLSVNFKRVNFWRKLAFVSVLGLAVETAQFVLAIGVTDITDLIANTLGGFLGLILYDLSNKYVDDEILDRFIVLVGTILLVSLILLRVLVFKVRY